MEASINQIDTYRALASAELQAAEKTNLANRREMHERSAAIWETMAASAEATAARALVNEAAKAQR